MIDFTKFAVTPESMKEFFEQNDFTKHIKGMEMNAVDPQALFAAQKKNMDALMEANAAAASGFQDLFRKQVEIFEETMNEAKAQVESMTSTLPDAKKAETQMEVMKAAVQKALGNMQALAETAQEANKGAYEAISGRVEESVEELKTMMDKMKP